jgi:hypothetical protein
MRLKGAWVVYTILIVTFLFASIVAKFWLSGQKKKFLVKREQIIQKLNGQSEISLALKAEITEFNGLVSQHLYLRYLDIPRIELPKP